MRYFISCIALFLTCTVLYAVNQNSALAPANPVEEYRISNEDASEPSYYGFTNRNGGWYIMKAAEVSSETFYSYAVGTTTYNTNWTNRALLTYTTFYMSF